RFACRSKAAHHSSHSSSSYAAQTQENVSFISLSHFKSDFFSRAWIFHIRLTCASRRVSWGVGGRHEFLANDPEPSGLSPYALWAHMWKAMWKTPPYHERLS